MLQEEEQARRTLSSATSENPFNFAGERVKKLAKRLTQNNTLTWLDMYRTRCGPKGATALGDALGKNHTLQHLLLRSNAVKSDGTLYLSKALANKSCALMTGEVAEPFRWLCSTGCMLKFFHVSSCHASVKCCGGPPYAAAH